MKRLSFKFFILTAMLLGLPMIGVLLAGHPMARYLEFPPESRYVRHAPFSWVAFALYTLLIVAVTFPVILKTAKSFKQVKIEPSPTRPFPWWGWLGVITGTVAWVLAWTRFPWFARFQPHTFTPLWLSFILVTNALCHRQTGRCMMRHRTGFFLLLFPVSAGFWWFFEYLNRFVQNWSYTGVHYSSWAYFSYATIAYSTVLPAVLGAQELIQNVSRVWPELNDFKPLGCAHPKISALAVLMISGAGLAGIGVWADYLFSLLWVSPLVIIVSLQVLMGERHVLSDMAHGNRRLAISSATAGLFCGVFWEMWNFYSLARWEYSIPFVDGFKIFEMPILGYAGYLPFGLECAAIGLLLERAMKYDNPF
jgi:hypothetical protein